jgi:tetratricopeptide (TPR) repeat protein
MRYLSFFLLLFPGLLWAQELDSASLSKMSMAQLDSIYKMQKKPKEQLPYALAMKQKGDLELNQTDTGYAKLIYKVATVYLNNRDYNNSADLFEKAANIWQQKNPLHIEYAGCLNNLGVIHFRLGKYENAEIAWLNTLTIRKAILEESHPDYVASLNNLGTLYRELGNYSNAEQYLIQALNLRKKYLGEENLDFAKSLNSVGILFTLKGEYKKAEDCFIQALNVRKNILGEEHPDYAASLNSLGSFYFSISDFVKAENYWLKTLNIQNNILDKDDPQIAISLDNLGNVYCVLKKYSIAEDYYNKALKIKLDNFGEEHPSYSNTLNNLGVLYKDMGEYTKAEHCALQAQKIQKKILGEDHPLYALVLNNIGVLYREMNNFSKAEEYYLQALSIQKSNIGEYHPELALGLDNLGIMFGDIGQFVKAYDYFSASFVIKTINLGTNFSWLPEKGKAAYWKKEKVFYDNLNNYAAQASATFPEAAALAYNANLIAKGLLLESSNEIKEAVALSGDSVVLKVYEELKVKKDLINQLASDTKQENLTIIEAEADSLDKILVTRLGDYAALKRKFQITWKDVQSVLSENEAAIEFSNFCTHQDSPYYYHALLIRKDYTVPKLIKLGLEKTIAEVPAGRGFSELYKLIWEPIDSFLQGVNTVYYSTDEYLNNISFTGLCSQGTEKVNNTKNIKRGNQAQSGSIQTSGCSYLSDKYTLHQLSTTRYLAEGLKDSKLENSILVFGGVNYDEIPSKNDTVIAPDLENLALAENLSRSSSNQSKMEYLPGTQAELEGLQKILKRKQWKVRAFSDKNASENTFKSEIKKESPSVLHIATHGFAFPDQTDKNIDSKTYQESDNPMARCGLLLAGANHSWTGKSDIMLSKTGEDGILTALEVSNLPLRNTKLVVLSACETGLGKIEGTEGTFGLKRGFKLAGVEQIIVSLWSVPDKETMELMDLFYNDLSKTHNAVISFEKAQKEMRKKYPTRPDLWAGFVLVR